VRSVGDNILLQNIILQTGVQNTALGFQAHRDGKRFIVKADDLLTAFLSPERDAIAPKEANGNATRPERRLEADKNTRLLCRALSYSHLPKIALDNFPRSW
jgi:hypothetical protein